MSPRSSNVIHRPFSIAANLSPEEFLSRQIQSLLNKLTLEKLESLFEKLVALPIFTPKAMQTVIALIFDKAVFEPKFCVLYAKLCKKLSERKEAELEDPQSGLKKNVKKKNFTKKKKSDLSKKYEYKFDYKFDYK